MYVCFVMLILIIFSVPSTIISSIASPDTCLYPDTMHLSQCENTTLATADTTTCLIARHLHRYIRSIEEKFLPCSAAVSYLNKRHMTFSTRKQFPIDYDHVQWLGDTAAPVTVIMYISMSCPHCKQVYKQLYDTLHTNANLQKNMRLGIKYRSDTRYEKVLHATIDFKKQPAFLRRCADLSGRMDDKAVKKITKMINIPYGSLLKNAYLDTNRLEVKISKQEAIDNEVRFTPAIFINNYRYHSTKTAPWILDAVEYYASKIKRRKRKEEREK